MKASQRKAMYAKKNYIHGSRQADIKARNTELSKIERKLEKLENVMLKDQGKGKRGDGRTPRAMKASREYEKYQDLISKIASHKYGHLEK